MENPRFFVQKNLNKIAFIDREHMRLVGLEKQGDHYNFLFVAPYGSQCAKIAKLTNDNFFRYSSNLHVIFVDYSQTLEIHLSKNGAPRVNRIIEKEVPLLSYPLECLALGEKFEGWNIRVGDLTGNLEKIFLEDGNVIMILNGYNGNKQYITNPKLPFYIIHQDTELLLDKLIQIKQK